LQQKIVIQDKKKQNPQYLKSTLAHRKQFNIRNMTFPRVIDETLTQMSSKPETEITTTTFVHAKR